MTVIEFLDSLIYDLKDDIADYEDDARRTTSRLEKQNLAIRIDELKRLVKMLKILRDEQDCERT